MCMFGSISLSATESRSFSQEAGKKISRRLRKGGQ